MVEGVWFAKKLSKPCVMTIYNWHRKGLNPRLLAWRWAVNQADRRWYISEFVWDSWEKKRRKGSGRLPVISRMPQQESPSEKRKGFLFIGLIGILLASIVNMFMQSTGLQFAISAIGVLVFAGLTAYDTQRIKAMYYDGYGQEGKKAIMGALSLYLNFINLFIMLIQLFGQRR